MYYYNYYKVSSIAITYTVDLHSKSIDLHSKSMDWFLYYRDLIIKELLTSSTLQGEQNTEHNKKKTLE